MNGKDTKAPPLGTWGMRHMLGIYFLCVGSVCAAIAWATYERKAPLVQHEITPGAPKTVYFGAQNADKIIAWLSKDRAAAAAQRAYCQWGARLNGYSGQQRLGFVCGLETEHFVGGLNAALDPKHLWVCVWSATHKRVACYSE